MAKDSKKRRPRDVNVRAFNIVQEAVGEEPKYEPAAEEQEKDAAAVALGRRGGRARARKLTSKELSEAARKAVEVRWEKEKADEG